MKNLEEKKIRREEDSGFTFTRFSQIKPCLKPLYYDAVYGFLSCLNFSYPNFKEWYRNLFDKNFELNPCREIIICKYGNNWAGISIFKNDGREKKICTMYIAKAYRKCGIARKMCKIGMEWMGIGEDSKPLMTLPKAREEEYKEFLHWFGFHLEQEYEGYGHKELVYNGILQ